MRDIATAADCSLGLAYRYFASKEDLVLELYRWLAVQLEELVPSLPPPIADRFHHLMHALLTVMAPHRLTLVALSGAALNSLSRADFWCGRGGGPSPIPEQAILSSSQEQGCPPCFAKRRAGHAALRTTTGSGALLATGSEQRDTPDRGTLEARS